MGPVPGLVLDLLPPCLLVGLVEVVRCPWAGTHKGLQIRGMVLGYQAKTYSSVTYSRNSWALDDSSAWFVVELVVVLVVIVVVRLMRARQTQSRQKMCKFPNVPRSFRKGNYEGQPSFLVFAVAQIGGWTSKIEG